MSDSVSIDKLTIEVDTNANQAKDGIEKLADALGKLKQNGSFGTAVKNLNSLATALKNLTPVTSNANKLSALAKSVDELSRAGSFTKVVNQLNKLPGALKGLSSLNIDNDLGAKLERLAQATTPLSNIKTGGLGTMVNALSRIGDVTAKLDDDTIGKFADRVKKLNTELKPLSTKMTTIQQGLRGINSSARSAGSGVKDLGKKVNATTLNLASMITVVQGVKDAIMPLVRLLSNTVSQAIEWDGVAARFGRGFGDQAEEIYAWIQRLNEEMGINIQQFMQYSSVYATMLTGFGVGIEDAGKMALGYTELTYDIWAGYNDVYKRFEDAAEAVKSAIAGEVEPVRRAGFTIVESTLEQTAANHGLEISLEKATEAQKSYLRYLTLVDQAHAQGLVGTYAKELNTAEGMMRTFSQQLKSLAQAFGSLFLPILVKVMPWLQAFVELLRDGIIYMASLFGIEIQAVDFSGYGGGLDNIGSSANDATDAVEGTTEALKDLKKATIGIDELNVISPPTENKGSGSGSGSGGAGGFDGLDIDSLWDEAIFDQVKSQVEDLKERIKGMLPIIGGIATAFAGWKIANLLTEVDDVVKKLGKLEPTVKNLAKGLAIAGITVAVGKLVWDFTGAYLEGGDEADLMKALGTTALGMALARWLAGKGAGGIVLAVSGIVTLTRLGVELHDGSVEITDPEAIVTGIVGSLSTIIGSVITWKALGPAITAAVKNLFGGATLASIGTTIGGALSSGWTAITSALASIPVWGWIAAAVLALIASAIGLAVVDYDFTEIGRKIGEAVGKAVGAVTNFAIDVGTAIGKGLKAAFEWAKENITWENVKKLVAVLFKKETWTEIIWPKIKEIGKSIWDGLWEGLSEATKNLRENITEFVNGFIKGFKDGFEIHSPSKKMIEIGKEILAGLLQPLSLTALKDKISEMWNNAKKWWTGKSALEKAEVAVTLVKSGWKTVSAWIGKIPGVSQAVKLAKSGWTSITKWIGSIPTVSQAVKLAKSGWTSVKGWIGTMPTLSANIKLVKSGWSTVKSWLGSLDFNLNFKLPKIGVKWGSKEVMGFKISYPSSFYTYAKGGFPDFGEVFIAREQGAGPEMVGRIGSKTTVANNDQIVEAVSEGVYSAVLAAMRASENNGAQAVNVYLDGRQITSSVEKRQHERGASLMGKEVFAY